MYGVLRFIEDHFSSYSIFLLFLSAFILVFMDARQLKKAGLKKESGFSFIAGIIYAALGVILFTMTLFFIPIR